MDDHSTGPWLVPRDTSAEADAMQLDAYRRMGGMARVRVAFQLTAMVRAAALAGIRSRHPAYSERQMEQAWQRLALGDELFAEVFPGQEPVEP